MDAGLLWTVIGSAAGVLGAALVAWQVRLQVADRREVRLGEDHPRTLMTRHGLARVISLQGRPGQAEHLYRRVLASRQRVLGDHHPATLTASHMLAQLTAGQGRYAEAGQLLRQVLTEREQLFGKDHPGGRSGYAVPASREIGSH